MWMQDLYNVIETFKVKELEVKVVPGLTTLTQTSLARARVRVALQESACACTFRRGGMSLSGWCTTKMTEKNIEHQSLIQFADDLTQLIQHNVISVSSKLFAKGLVAKDVHDSVLSVDGASNQSKAAKLLSCVLDKIKESSDQYHPFIDVLGEDSYFDNIVLKITKVCGKHHSNLMYDDII
jgi:siroheme synthase